MDRESHRAAVEAGYASLRGYIEKWGNSPKPFPPGDNPEDLEPEDEEDTEPLELPDEYEDE